MWLLGLISIAWRRLRSGKLSYGLLCYYPLLCESGGEEVLSNFDPAPLASSRVNWRFLAWCWVSSAGGGKLPPRKFFHFD